MTIRFIKAQSGTQRVKNQWSKDWPNWTGVVPQVGDTVLLHFGDYNEECVPCNVVKRYIDGTNPDVVTCLIENIRNTDEDQAEPSEQLSPEKKALLNQKVEELDLSVNTRNLLRANGIDTILDLCRLKKTDWLKFRNAGRKSLIELDDFLTDHNLTWGMNV
jgi:hypothetical protein